MAFWSVAPDGRVRIYIQVGPGASRTELVEVRADQLRIRVAAAPEKGKANAELVDFLADVLAIRKSAIVVENGQTSRKKTLSVPAECLAAVKLLGGER